MDVENDKDLLPYEKIAAADIPSGSRWLVESLWLESACGILGGQPKCCKTWLGLDLAVSIASPPPCLGRINVLDPGPTLVYLAEDSGPLGSGRGAVTKSRVKAQLVPFPLAPDSRISRIRRYRMFSLPGFMRHLDLHSRHA
jgi:hypothetical protein